MSVQEVTYTLMIRPRRDDDDPGGIRRLRALLKRIVRGYGFRVVGVQPLRDGTEGACGELSKCDRGLPG